MQYKQFSLSAADNGGGEQDLNRFLRSHRVLEVQTAYDQRSGCWSLLVSYMDGEPSDAAAPVRRGREREDPTKDLSPELKDRFEQLANIRRTIARREEIAAFHIFTNVELVSIARLAPPLTVKAIGAVSGVGEKRAAQYGPELIKIDDETGREPDAENSPF